MSTKRKFQVGDRVKCVDGAPPRLEGGEEYTIVAVGPSLLSAAGVPGQWFKDRFELVESANDNAPAGDAPFKVGDRVACDGYYSFDPSEGVVAEITSSGAVCVKLDTWSRDGWMANGPNWAYRPEHLRLVTPARPCIVARLNSIGQPLPSSRPFVHADRDAATAEAERLASLHLGAGFAVYELVSTSRAPKPEVVTEAA